MNSCSIYTVYCSNCDNHGGRSNWELFFVAGSPNYMICKPCIKAVTSTNIIGDKQISYDIYMKVCMLDRILNVFDMAESSPDDFCGKCKQCEGEIRGGISRYGNFRINGKAGSWNVYDLCRKCATSCINK